MPVSVSHALSMTTPDNPAYENKPSDWNQTHAFTLNAAGSEISGAFGNGGGVSFGLSANGLITASAPAAAPSPVNFSAGTASGDLGSVVFSDGNGVSFGLDGSTITATVKTDYLTTAMLSNAATISNIRVSAGTTSNLLSALTFANSNGLTFGLNASTLTASHNGLTTARASTDAVGLNTAQSNVTWTVNSSGISIDARGYAGTGTTFNGTNLSATMTLNSNGLRLDMSAGAGGAGDGGNVLAAGTRTAGTNSTVLFSNANGISFGLDAVNGSIMTASYVPGGGAQTGISGLVVSDATYTSGTVTFENANGITFGSSGANGISASHNGLTSQSNQALSGSNGSFTFQTATFGALNGLSFYTSNGSMVGSYTVPTVTNSAWTVSDAATSGTVARLAFTNLNGVTLSLSSGANGSHTIVGSHNALTSQSNQNVTAGNGGFAFQTLSFSNLNGISFGTSAGSAITASHNGLTTARASNDAVGLATAKSNVTWTVNSAGLSLDARGYAGTGTTFNGANLSASMTFNSNGLNLSMSAAAPGGGGGAAVSLPANGGSRTSGGAGYSNISTGTAFLFGNNITMSQDGASITVSANAPGAAAENNWVNLLGANTAGNTTASGSTLGFSGVNLTLSGTNGSVINFSAPATSSLSAVGNISLSTNGSTISFICPTEMTFGTWENRPLGASTTTQWTNNQLWLAPFRVMGGAISASTMRLVQSMSGTYTSAATAQFGETIRWGIYTRHATNSTRYDTWSTGSFTLKFWNSGTSSASYDVGGTTSSSAGSNIFTLANGIRIWPIPIATTLVQSEYIMGLIASTSSANYSALNSRYGMYMDKPGPVSAGFGVGGGVANSLGMQQDGTYSVTTTNFPSSIGLSEIFVTVDLTPYFKLGAN